MRSFVIIPPPTIVTSTGFVGLLFWFIKPPNFKLLTLIIANSRYFVDFLLAGWGVFLFLVSKYIGKPWAGRFIHRHINRFILTFYHTSDNIGQLKWATLPWVGIEREILN